MRAIATLLLFAGLLGCQQGELPLDPERSLGSTGSERMLTTDRESYAAGAQAVLTLRNTRQQALGYNLCSSVLERRHDGAWRAAEHGNDRVCTLELRILQPGGSDSFTMELDRRLPAGEYRFRTPISDMEAGTGEQLASNTFQVTR